MQEAINKAAALVEAQAYIRRFNGKQVVVKVGGSIMDDPEALTNLLRDVCFMHAVGMRPIVVHGGGKGITAAMEQAGLEAQFVQGRRYTDERTLAIAEHVLVNDINAGMLKTIADDGYRGMGLHSLSSCAVLGKRLFLEGEAGRQIDIGSVGEVTGVNAELLHAVTEAGIIPVIAPIARDPAGGKLNINADSVAGHVAASGQSCGTSPSALGRSGRGARSRGPVDGHDGDPLVDVDVKIRGVAVGHGHRPPVRAEWGANGARLALGRL